MVMMLCLPWLSHFGGGVGDFSSGFGMTTASTTGLMPMSTLADCWDMGRGRMANKTCPSKSYNSIQLQVLWVYLGGWKWLKHHFWQWFWYYQRLSAVYFFFHFKVAIGRFSWWHMAWATALRHIASQTSEGALAALGEACLHAAGVPVRSVLRGPLGLVSGGFQQTHHSARGRQVNGDIMTGQMRKTSWELRRFSIANARSAKRVAGSALPSEQTATWQVKLGREILGSHVFYIPPIDFMRSHFWNAS